MVFYFFFCFAFFSIIFRILVNIDACKQLIKHKLIEEKQMEVWYTKNVLLWQVVEKSKVAI